MMEHDALVFKAKLAAKARRFDEMVRIMKEVAKRPRELTFEERNLLSVACKAAIQSRIASWRVIYSAESKADVVAMSIIKDYKAEIESEIVKICNDISSDMDESLIPNSSSEEAKVFYHQMKRDFTRHLSILQKTRKMTNCPMLLCTLEIQKKILYGVLLNGCITAIVMLMWLWFSK